MIENGTVTSQAASAFKKVKEEIESTKTAYSVIHLSELGSLLKKPSPRRFAEDREKSFSAYGSNAQAIVNAQIKVEQVRRKLHTYLTQRQESFQQKTKLAEKLKKMILH